MPSGILAVIPVKELSKAKSRLSCILSEEERKKIARRLLVNTLKKINNSKKITTIAVLTKSVKSIKKILKPLNLDKKILFIDDKIEELNLAIRQITALDLIKNFEALIIIPIDLPLLETHDIDTMINKGKSLKKGIVISKSYNNGTSLLLLKPPNVIPTFFGENSYLKHIKYAKMKNLEVVTYNKRNLEFDIDLPEDVFEMLLMSKNKRMKNMFRRIDLFSRLSVIAFFS